MIVDVGIKGFERGDGLGDFGGGAAGEDEVGGGLGGLGWGLADL